MPNISMSCAKDRFAAIEKNKKKELTDEEERALQLSEKTSRLKELRLAKEATDKKLRPLIK
ncbi:MULTISPECIES: hypothetical protein [unclassified Pseudovibrio]|uniref:hypothetical protein n=1 Tax=unclassified Pseudovibrio TaxID=2627060 RepID=UPI000B05704D|nr:MULTISPECIES: hypothetical protein [unclassified Pseudovibrio]